MTWMWWTTTWPKTTTTTTATTTPVPTPTPTPTPTVVVTHSRRERPGKIVIYPPLLGACGAHLGPTVLAGGPLFSHLFEGSHWW